MSESMRVTLPTGEVVEYEIPNPPPVDWAVPDSPALVELVRRIVTQVHDVAEWLGSPVPSDPVERATWDTALANRIHALLVDARPPQHGEIPEMKDVWFGDVARSAAMTPAGLLKLVVASGRFHPQLPVSEEFTIQHHMTGRPSLLELAVLLDDCGLDGTGAVFEAYTSWWSLGEHWADDAVWPFFARNLDRLLAFQARRATFREDHMAFYRALRTFPALPDVVVDTLYELALGTRKKDREAAQKLLRQHHDRTRRASIALTDRKRDVRIVAADWLSRIKDPAAVPALEHALARERNEAAKAAILGALLGLGRRVEGVLTPDELNRAAAKAAGKPLPKALVWFPWDALPAVRWAGTGEEVPRGTLVWLIADAVKRKSPEPSPLLPAYCRMFRADDRERLGRFLLEAWLAEDVRPLPRDKALEAARNRAISLRRHMAAFPSVFAGDPEFGLTVEELTERALAEITRQPAGSAISSKGLLAVVAACAGPDVVPLVEQYLTKWYGQRANQCKALLAMLSWIDHPLAIQLLLSVAARFRTKGIQEAAERLADELATRRGWTMADLADRSIPTAGFDREGRLDLSYGSRVFTALLTPDLAIELRNPDGKTIKALPAPCGSDDEERAKAAKKALSTARKQLKTTVKQQTERLYEAMCTGRTWRVDDWRTFLAAHPVMRHLVPRLVWTATWGDSSDTVTFRPLEDGTFTDAHDNEVSLPEDSTIALAHAAIVTAGEAEAWAAHLADYEVTPLFPQFGREVFRLSPERRRDREIKDFDGVKVEAFALRGRATKLGYVRGPVEDAGWFYDYRKHFPTLDITTVVRFSGSYLPEENLTVSLEELVFQRGDREHPMPLGKVPEVLLSEAYHDVRLIAEGGTT